jgi:hypothetical protein
MKFLATMALLTVIATPTFAQSSSGSTGPQNGKTVVRQRGPHSLAMVPSARASDYRRALRTIRSGRVQRIGPPMAISTTGRLRARASSSTGRLMFGTDRASPPSLGEYEIEMNCLLPSEKSFLLKINSVALLGFHTANLVFLNRILIVPAQWNYPVC